MKLVQVFEIQGVLPIAPDHMFIVAAQRDQYKSCPVNLKQGFHGYEIQDLTGQLQVAAAIEAGLDEIWANVPDDEESVGRIETRTKLERRLVGIR